MNDVGKWLIGLGALLALIGGIVLLLGRVVNLGQLPGDISVDRPGFSFRFPVVTSIVVSLVLTVLLNILLRLLRR